MRDPIARFVRDESGANRFEYALLAAVAVVGALMVLESLGISLERIFTFTWILAVVLLLTGSAAVGIYLYTQARETACRWRRLSANDRPPFKGWVCRHCGEEGYSRDRWWPPKECKRALRNAT